MTDDSLRNELAEGLLQTSMLDAHTHLTGGRLGARGLHDVLLYRTVVSLATHISTDIVFDAPQQLVGMQPAE